MPNLKNIHPVFIVWGLGLALFFLLGWFGVAHATDIGSGMVQDVRDTANGSLKTLMYVAEAVGAFIAYLATRKVVVFGGVLALAVFLDVAFKMAFSS